MEEVTISTAEKATAMRRRPRGGTVRYKNLAEAMTSPIMMRASTAVRFAPSCRVGVGRATAAATTYTLDLGSGRIISPPSPSPPAARMRVAVVGGGSGGDDDDDAASHAPESGETAAAAIPIQPLAPASDGAHRSDAATDSAVIDTHPSPPAAGEGTAATTTTTTTTTDDAVSPVATSDAGRCATAEGGWPLVITAGACVQGWRRTMEDRLVSFYTNGEGEGGGAHGVIVLDGHRGDCAVEHASRQLPFAILQQLRTALGSAPPNQQKQEKQEEYDDSHKSDKSDENCSHDGTCNGVGGDGEEQSAPLPLRVGGADADGASLLVDELPVPAALYTAVTNAFLAADAHLLAAQIRPGQAERAVGGIRQTVARAMDEPTPAAMFTAGTINSEAAAATATAAESVRGRSPTPRGGSGVAAPTCPSAGSPSPPRWGGASPRGGDAPPAASSSAAPTRGSAELSPPLAAHDGAPAPVGVVPPLALSATTPTAREGGAGFLRSARSDASPRLGTGRSPQSLATSATNFTPREWAGGRMLAAGPPQRRLSVTRGYDLPHPTTRHNDDDDDEDEDDDDAVLVGEERPPVSRAPARATPRGCYSSHRNHHPLPTAAHAAAGFSAPPTPASLGAGAFPLSSLASPSSPASAPQQFGFVHVDSLLHRPDPAAASQLGGSAASGATYVESVSRATNGPPGSSCSGSTWPSPRSHFTRGSDAGCARERVETVDPSAFLADTSGTTALLLLLTVDGGAVALTTANVGDSQAFLVERRRPAEGVNTATAATSKATTATTTPAAGRIVSDSSGENSPDIPPSAAGEAQLQGCRPSDMPAANAAPTAPPRGFTFRKTTSDHRPAANDAEHRRLHRRFGPAAFLSAATGLGEAAASDAELEAAHRERLLLRRVGGRLAVSRSLGDFDLKLSRLPVALLHRYFCANDAPSLEGVLRASVTVDSGSATGGGGGEAIEEPLSSALVISSVPEVRTFRIAPPPPPPHHTSSSSSSIMADDDDGQHPQVHPYVLLVAGSDGVWELQSVVNVAQRAEAHLQPLLRERARSSSSSSSSGSHWDEQLQRALRAVVRETLAAGISANQPGRGGGIGGDNMTLTVSLITY